MRRAEALIALVVGVAATASPRALLRLFGIAPREVTGAAALGWRLFGVRTAVVGAAALRGDGRAQAAVLPVQIADQVVFAHALRTRAVPPRAAVMAMATSGVIIVLDLAARRAERGGGHDGWLRSQASTAPTTTSASRMAASASGPGGGSTHS